MGSESPEVKSVPTLSKQQKPVADLLSSLLQGGFGQGGTPYPGPFVAGLSDLTQLALGGAGEYLRSIPSLTGETGAALSRSLSGVPTSEVDLDLSEQLFRQGPEAAAMRLFQNLSPEINKPFIGSGAFHGSDILNARNRAAGDIASQMGALRSDWLRADLEAQRGLGESAANRALQASPLAMAYGNLPMERLGWGAQMGQIPQSQEQAELSAKYQDWMRTFPGGAEDQQRISQAMQFLGIPMIGTYGVPGKMGIGELFGMSLAGSLGASLGGGEIDEDSLLYSLLSGMTGGGFTGG